MGNEKRACVLFGFSCVSRIPEMRAPSVMVVPAGMSHAVQGDVANTVMQLVGVGPFDVTWVNPSPHQQRR